MTIYSFSDLSHSFSQCLSLSRETSHVGGPALVSEASLPNEIFMSRSRRSLLFSGPSSHYHAKALARACSSSIFTSSRKSDGQERWKGEKPLQVVREVATAF